MTPVLLRQLRHDVWATEQLLAYCRSLTRDQLELSVPGTYGSIRATLAHIVAADEWYLLYVGTVVHDPILTQPAAQHATLDELATHLAHVKDSIERVFARGEAVLDRVVPDPGDASVEDEAWVPLAQFVHHGNDHRAQIGTILGAHGLETPNLQTWAYALEIGAERAVTR